MLPFNGIFPGNISAINLKQVKIQFASKVTDSDLKDDVEDIDNYTLEDKDGDEVKDVIKEVKLDDDKKSATLTFRDLTEDKKDNYVIENHEKYTLIIDEDVADKEVKKELTFKDVELPQINDVEVVGIDTIKVKFSEPIQPSNLPKIADEWRKDKKETAPILDKDYFDVNDGDLSIRRVELVNNNTEANVVVSSDFKDGEKVSVKVKASVRDYAGLAVVAGTKDATVKEDKKAPQVVGFKDAESDEVTLIFDKDVKFADTEDLTLPKGHSDLEKFYHTSDKSTNYAKEVKIDGKEVTIKFDDDSISDGGTNIYIKSDVLQSRWEIKNDKVSYKITRDEDKVAPELVKVEQDEDYNDRIKIRFSEKVKLKGDGSATKTGNYTLKDEKGKEWKIKEIKQDGDSQKEFVIYTTKDLDDDLKYKLTVESVEDKSGNAIKKVTKEFEVKDNDGVDSEDVTVTVYSAGKNDQKILVDFDSKMTMDNSKYSAKDLSKYTLVAEKAVFDGKKAITLDELYKASIKSAKDGKAVEIAIPGKESGTLKDKQFNLEKGMKLTLQIARVADEKGNITDRTFSIDAINFSDGKSVVGFDKDEDYIPQAKSVEDIYFAFDDKVNFDSDDIMVVAVDASKTNEEKKAKAESFAKLHKDNKDKSNEEKDAEGKLTAITLPVAKFKPGTNGDGNTEILMSLDKDLKDKRYDDDDLNHILTYDGKFAQRDADKASIVGNEKNKLKENKLDVFVVVLGDKDGKTKTDNDYDETLKLGATPIKDKIAPAIVNNKDRADKYKYIGSQRFGEATSTLIKDDEAVEYTYDADNDKGTITLTFEENLDRLSVNTSTFELKKGDFKDAKIESATVVHGNQVEIHIKNLINQTKDTDKNKVEIEQGFEIIQKGPIKDEKGTEIEGLNLQVGSFVEEAIARINTLKDKETSSIADLTDYTQAQITGVVAGNLDAVNTAIATGKKAKDGSLSKKEIQEAVSKVVSNGLVTEAKAKLTTAISEANTNKGTDKVTVSADGTDVLPANKWVLQAAMTAYTNAITAAQTVVDKADATQTEVDNAVTALGTATTAFNDAKKAGTKVVVAADATAPSAISLTAGSTAAATIGTNVKIPAAAGTDTTGTVTGWVNGTADKVKFTVTDATGTSTIKINGGDYVSGADYTITEAKDLTIVVTTTEAGKTTVTRTFTVKVTA